MIRAAFVPYLGGRAGLIIVDDARPVLSHAWDVGELVPNPHAALERDHAYLRAVEPHHVQALTAEVMTLLREHGAALLIEEPRGSGPTAAWSRLVGDAVADAARAAGVAVEYRPRVAAPAGAGERAILHAAALLGGAAQKNNARLPDPGAGVGVAARYQPAPPSEEGRDLNPRLPRESLHITPTTEIKPWSSCVIAYDLGSASLGVTVVADALPLDVLHAVTLGVDPTDLDVVVAVCVEIALRVGATRAAIEHGVKFHAPYYTIPEGATPAQISAILGRHRAQTASMAQNHVVCGKLQEKLTAALVAAGIEAVTWARESWAHRVVQRHQGGVSTAAANEALRARCAPGSWERLRDQHQRDGAGVACMWLIDPPAPPRRHRHRVAPTVDASVPVAVPLTPEQKLERERRSWRESKRAHPHGGRPVDATAAERAAVGCVCPAKHRRECEILKRRRAARGEHEPKLRGYVPGAIPVGKSFLR